MTTLDAFKKRQYLNLQTFRKNGQGVPTPVWFVQEDEILYVSTQASSGKVKRIRNNTKVNIAPCAMDGRLLGEWVEARARLVEDPDLGRKLARLVNRKYGLLGRLLAFRSRKSQEQPAILEIRLAGEEAK